MKLHNKPVADVTVLLTVFKRKTLRKQVEAILSQTVKPARIVVFQNERHIRLPIRFLRTRGIDYVQNSRNTKYFGRFAYLLEAETEYLAVFDDDVIPGARCLENYLNQVKEIDAIVGGNGRIARTNPSKDLLTQPHDVGLRPIPTLVDFVGHVWVFRKRHLFDMFSLEPQTFGTGEDMHLCFSSKLRSGTPSYAAAQPTLEDSCDTSRNQFADDDVASFRSTPKSERESVEAYFAAQGVTFISPEQQSDAEAAWQSE